MKKVNFKKVIIKSFRNLIDKEYDLSANTTFFTGRNAIGKTNVLNSIMWCLTGSDLKNCSVDSINVPFDKNVADVTVEMDVGTVRRVYTLDVETKKGSSKIYINGIECKSSKDADIQIDKMIGTLELSTYAPKGFNVRSFLLNPYYLFCSNIRESTVREFLFNLVKNKVSKDDVLKTLESGIANRLTAMPSWNSSIDEITAQMKIDIEDTKKSILYWGAVVDYLSKYLKDHAFEVSNANRELSAFKKELMNCNQDQVALDTFLKEYEKALSEQFCTDLPINIKFFEKTDSEAVKPICKVYTNNDNVTLNKASTAEQIVYSSIFISTFVTKYGNVSLLPFVIDEGETLDTGSVKKLFENCHNQIIMSCVGNNEGLEVRRFN